MEGTLEGLRKAATCSICTEFFKIPKKLPNCSHVFCLHCLQRHMQINSGKNYPPCPMCRKPIICSLSEIPNLCPGITEQEVVAFVKQYETCDLCKLNSNPNFRCEKCNSFVCNNCLPCHKTLKQCHNVIPIIPTRGTYNIPLKVAYTCPKHNNQPLDLFCIVCRQLLCIHCKEFSHEHCERHTELEYELYRRGFLLFFVNLNDNLKLQFQSNKRNRIVYITNFADAARKWMKEAHVDLKSCITFFKEVKSMLENVSDKTGECLLFQQRRQNIISKIEKIESFGHNTNQTMDELLNETTSDVKVSETILSTEDDCLEYFRYRQKYCSYTLFLGSKTLNGSNVNHSSKCILTEFPGKCTLIMQSTYFRPLPVESVNVNGTLASNVLATSFIGEETDFGRHDLTSQLEKANEEESFLIHSLLQRQLEKPRTCTEIGRTCLHNAYYTVNCLYQNKFLDKYELMHQSMPFASFQHCVSVDEICRGYVDRMQLDRWATMGISGDFQTGIYFEMPSQFHKIHTTSLANIVSLPTYYCLQDKHLHTRTHQFRSDGIGQFVVHFAGNSEYGAGLRSVFLYADPPYPTISDSASNGKGLRGISINANVAKFNKHHNPINILDGSACSDPEVKVIKEEKNAFTFVKSRHCHSSNYLMAYRSISTPNELHGEFSLVCYTTGNELVKTCIPMTFLHTDLLCHLESGLYFAKHEDNDDITIGNITFSLEEIAQNIVHTVRQSDTNIPLGKLKPFTMVEREDKSIITVCAIEGDNSMFIMIRTDRKGAEAIEVLEIDYSVSELRVHKAEDNAKKLELGFEIIDGSAMYDEIRNSENPAPKSNVVTESRVNDSVLETIAGATLVDIEMDREGNIMFLLEIQDNKSYCVCAKYFMP